MGQLPRHLEKEMEEGHRLVVIGHLNGAWEDDEHLPAGIRPLYAVVLEDTIRPNAEEALEFFVRKAWM